MNRAQRLVTICENTGVDAVGFVLARSIVNALIYAKQGTTKAITIVGGLADFGVLGKIALGKTAPKDGTYNCAKTGKGQITVTHPSGTKTQLTKAAVDLAGFASIYGDTPEQRGTNIVKAGFR